MVFFTAIYLHQKNNSPKNVLDKALQIMNVIKCWPSSTYLFNILCDTVGSPREALLLRAEVYGGCIEAEHVCDCLNSKRKQPLVKWHMIFLWNNNWQTMVIQKWVFVIHFLQKAWNEPVTSIKKKKPHKISCNAKTWPFKLKLDFWEIASVTLSLMVSQDF